MFLFMILSNIFLLEHFRVTVAKPLKHLYQPLILGTQESERKTSHFFYFSKNLRKGGGSSLFYKP